MIRGDGPYANSRRGREPWLDDGAGMEVGPGGLSERLSVLSVGEEPSRDHLFQVKKAVEDAEAIIVQQLDENNQLREELLRTTRELEKYKSGTAYLGASADVFRDEPVLAPSRSYPPNSPAGNEADRIRCGEGGSSENPHRTLVIRQNGIQQTDKPLKQSSVEVQQHFENGKVNGVVNGFSGALAGIDSTGQSQFSSPSSRTLTPSRHRKEGENDPKFNPSKDVLLPVSEINSNILWKQDLVIKVRQREEEINQLRKHLVDYSIKEAQICSEKSVLEKRIAYMRMAFDQQQQDLVDAASKALSYRQEIIEENVRLTYALQAAQQERTTFLSSLLPLLSEHSLQPPVLDALSIVSNLKVLFKHLQEKLIIIEEKLTESQYQLAPWPAEAPNNSSLPAQSLSHPLGAALASSNKNRLEIVPQQTYAHVQSPVSSPSNTQRRADWEALWNQNLQTAPSGVPTKNMEHDAVERNSPLISRNFVAQEALTRVNHGDAHAVRFSLESKNQNLSFTDLVRGTEDDPNSFPQLPSVLEEPSSSFSEEDDPLPAISGLQISGEAFPGRELIACGLSINGTTTCNFEWMRYLEDGSFHYIEGAKRPQYVVTVDDVDSYLAIQVQPQDERKRKGELVKVFANEQRKITFDPKMQEQIERVLSVGHVSLEVLGRVSDTWEHAILAIKREAYSIKWHVANSLVVTEKFLTTTTISTLDQLPDGFIIQCADCEYLLQAADRNLSRDMIVWIMRLFKNRAVEKSKRKKKGLFF